MGGEVAEKKKAGSDDVVGGGEQGRWLTEEEVQSFEDDGYLLLQGFATDEEIRRLRARMDELIEGFDPSSTKSIFSTKEQKRRTDDYFFKSANNISFFFEEKAYDNHKDALTRAKHVSINKAGHALHDLDPVFRSFSRSTKVEKVMRSLGYRRPIPIQSMYIFKQPGIGGEVVPHQDSTFLYTEPPSCVGIWIALEDATTENGCLWALPGSHRDRGGKPVRRMVREEGGEGEGGGGSTVRFVGGDLPDYDLAKFRPVEVAAGTAVILHGCVVHNSYENTSPKSRHAYSLHLVESDGCRWEPDNWLQRDEGFPFQPLYAPSSS